MQEDRLAPIPGCSFGREVKWGEGSPGNLREALHEHGMLLFRGVPGDSSNALADRVRGWFPDMPIETPRTNLPADGGPMTVLGSTRAPDGSFNADYVPASTAGAPLLDPDGTWNDVLEASLHDWVAAKQECTFMEWHTDATFIRWPTSYAALYCRQSGASHTGFSNAVDGLAALPKPLRQLAEAAVCVYRPSIIYGNATLGIPAIGSRTVQLTAMNSEFTTEVNGSLEAPPHPDDPVVCHRLVQAHPHTGARSLRFSLKSLETLIPDPDHPEARMPPTDGKRAAWQIMRAATAGSQAYLHPWQTGDLFIWDERLTMHCRVPYDADNNVREMWRMVFEKDPADLVRNERSPQLDLAP